MTDNSSFDLVLITGIRSSFLDFVILIIILIHTRQLRFMIFFVLATVPYIAFRRGMASGVP
jgi:hypothetical protein